MKIQKVWKSFSLLFIDFIFQTILLTQEKKKIKKEVGPCLGYDRSYKSICYFRDIVPKKETITQIQVLENHKHKSLNLFEFSHASIGELVVLIQGIILFIFFFICQLLFFFWVYFFQTKKQKKKNSFTI